MGELVYMIDKAGERIVITGITERKYAEKNNLRHLTTICAPFLVGGESAGNLIVHDRYGKQKAKGALKYSGVYKSLNLFGGHTTPTKDGLNLIGTFVTEAILFDGLCKEMGEELLRKSGNDSEPIPYDIPLFKAIPVGFTEYTDENKKNNEYSYVFALPVNFSDYESLIAADDYEEKDIQLPVENHSLEALKAMWLAEKLAVVKSGTSEVEVCDAIFRLFLPENKPVHDKLEKIIKIYKR